MKKHLFFALFVVITIAFPCVAQGQTMDELDIAIARANEARTKAGDFESPAYFPSEWEAAEAQFTHAEAQKTLSAYNTAADAFNALFDLTIPLYAQAREDEIMVLRDDLVHNGARNSFPDYFLPADQAALLAFDQYEARDFYTARDSAAKALSMYEVLTSVYEAWLVRQEIRERDFASYDPDNFDRAGEIISEAMDAYETGDNAAALEKAEDAIVTYKLVLANGWARYAELRSSLAETGRQTALNNKANIAARDLFNEANANYTAAAAIHDSRDYEEAAKQFIHAEALFITASNTATEKRAFAAEAIEEAHKKIAESDETARQAEIILRGGSK
ncbi:MAG: hypothetical protein FWD36_00780 [Treponema sp.]|nr:hypothetical protein [Treponema sp.]